MHRFYPIRYMAALMWLGAVLSISFMEAPLKFQAPSVTLAIGLEIGRLVFGALNKAEWAFLILMYLSVLMGGAGRRDWILLPAISAVLIVQSIWLLPSLDARALVIINGMTPATNSLHVYYVALEVVKVNLLGLVIFNAVYSKNNRALEILS